MKVNHKAHRRLSLQREVGDVETQLEALWDILTDILEENPKLLKKKNPKLEKVRQILKKQKNGTQ